MVDEEGKKDKFEFDAAGEAVGYISMAQARILAMQTAREEPGDYGSEYLGVSMFFEVAGDEEDEDYYHVRLSFRPLDNFSGTPGAEEFAIEKNGTVAFRQVVSSLTSAVQQTPERDKGGSGSNLRTLLLVVGGLAIVGVVVGILFAADVFSGTPDQPVAALALPATPRPVAPSMLVATVAPASPIVTMVPTAPTITLAPTPTMTSVPTNTATPVPIPKPAVIPAPVGTAIPLAAATVRPTWTPIPVNTSVPTSTHVPTNTPYPTLVSTVTPVKVPVFQVPVDKSVAGTKNMEVEKVFSSYGEAPQLTQRVQGGVLPTVEERLPKQPMIIPTFGDIGKYGGTLRRAYLGPGDGCNFFRVSRASLVRFSTEGFSILPSVARGWVVNDDGTEWTFYLREGMKWSDGDDFNADDFMFQYQDVIMNDELTPSKPAFLKLGDRMGEVAKVDDYTVKFSFPNPNHTFLEIVAQADEACYGDTRNVPWAPAHYT